MQQFADRPVRVFVVWEPVLATDWGQPSTAALARISDRRASQFWDKGRLISHSIGAHNRRNVVWDYIAVYTRGAVWNERPPEALYQGGPVVDVIEPAQVALAQALQKAPHPQ